MELSVEVCPQGLDWIAAVMEIGADQQPQALPLAQVTYGSGAQQEWIGVVKQHPRRAWMNAKTDPKMHGRSTDRAARNLESPGPPASAQGVGTMATWGRCEPERREPAWTKFRLFCWNVLYKMAEG